MHRYVHATAMLLYTVCWGFCSALPLGQRPKDTARSERSPTIPVREKANSQKYIYIYIYAKYKTQVGTELRPPGPQMGPRLSQPSVQVAAVSAELRPPGVRMDPRHSQPNTHSHIYKTSGAYEAGWPEPPPCARARRAGPPQRGHHSVACTRGDPARSGAPTRPLARSLRGASARAS